MCDLWAKGKQLEAVEEQVARLSRELYAQRMATSAMAQSFDGITHRLRQDLCAQLKNCNRQYDQRQNEETSSAKQNIRELQQEHDQCFQNNAQSKNDVAHLKVRVEKDDVNKTDAVNLRSFEDTVELRLDRLEELYSQVQKSCEQYGDKCDKAVAFLNVEMNEMNDEISGVRQEMRKFQKEYCKDARELKMGRLGNKITTNEAVATQLDEILSGRQGDKLVVQEIEELRKLQTVIGRLEGGASKPQNQL